MSHDADDEDLKEALDMLVECVAVSAARIAHLYAVLEAAGIDIDDPMKNKTIH